MAASTIPLILLHEALFSWEMEFITSYFVAPLMDMLNYTASGVKERRMRMFTYGFPLLGFGIKPPPPLPETQRILAILQSWELAECLATESFSCSALVQWIFWFLVAFSCAVPGLILWVANGTRAPDSLWRFSAWKIFPQSCPSTGITCFLSPGINIKITHSWVVCLPLRNPGVVTDKLQQSEGIGAIRRDWGLKALHPLLLLSMGKRRQLCQDFWGRSGKRRFFEEP